MLGGFTLRLQLYLLTISRMLMEMKNSYVKNKRMWK